jgi:hypothetical protein
LDIIYPAVRNALTHVCNRVGAEVHMMSEFIFGAAMGRGGQTQKNFGDTLLNPDD